MQDSHAVGHGHGLEAGPGADDALTGAGGSRRELSLADPYGTASGVTLFSGTVTAVEPRDCGPQAGTLETPGGAVVGSDAVAQLRCVDAIVDPDGAADYVFVDFERTVPVVALALLYALVVVLVARWRGLRAILGLGLAFGVLFWFMVPALLESGPPLWVGLVGCSLIMVVVLYFAHGFSLRTTTALLGTLIGLGMTAVLAAWGTDAAYLTGMGDEYSYVLASVPPCPC